MFCILIKLKIKLLLAFDNIKLIEIDTTNWSNARKISYKTNI